MKAIICFISLSTTLLLHHFLNHGVYALSMSNLPQCETLKSEISSAEEEVRVRKHFNGLWVSPRCEIQPGPKFILRRYHFYRDMNFRVVRFYFNDPWCCSPAFSVTAVGRFETLSRWTSSSWIVPGGLEMEYFISKIVLVPFSQEKALFLSSKVNESCPGLVRKPWRPHKKYIVLDLEYPSSNLPVQGSSVDEIDCTRHLDLTFYELQLLRVEQRPVISYLRHLDASSRRGRFEFDHHKNHHNSDNQRLELYLGAELPGVGLRPTSYQSSLFNPKEPGCDTCHLVEKASRTSPPRLCTVLDNQHRFDLEGEWISQRCEVRPQGFFLKQHFTFRTAKREWMGEHVYFLDQNCRKRMFTLKAQGHYFKGPLSKVIPGARDMDFRIEQATLTPEDIQFVNNLNGLDNNNKSCSLNTKWKRKVPVNLTATSGCKALGVFVPSIELDLVKLEKHRYGDTMLLYLGQAVENGSRPTSFQPPLLNCRSKGTAEDIDNFLRPMAQVQLPNSAVRDVDTIRILVTLTLFFHVWFDG